MESNGYHTFKELHNGQFYVNDYIFVTKRLYQSLRRRGVIDEYEQEDALVNVKPPAAKKTNKQL